MGTELITIESLASKFGLTLGSISTSNVGVKLPLKTKLLRCIEREIEIMKDRETTDILFKQGKVKEVRFHRLIDGNKLEVSVKYKGKKHGIISSNTENNNGIVCENNITSLKKTLDGIYALYESIPEDNAFYAEDGE